MLGVRNNNQCLWAFLEHNHYELCKPGFQEEYRYSKTQINQWKSVKLILRHKMRS